MLNVQIHYPTIIYETIYLEVEPAEAADIMLMSSQQKLALVRSELVKQLHLGQPRLPIDGPECVSVIVE